MYQWYTGWPRKNGMAYFPQYVDAITGISVWGNFSWEKWYQDQQFWFSTLFSRAHFVRQCWGPKFSIYSCHCHCHLLPPPPQHTHTLLNFWYHLNTLSINQVTSYRERAVKADIVPETAQLLTYLICLQLWADQTGIIARSPRKYLNICCGTVFRSRYRGWGRDGVLDGEVTFIF